MGALFGGAAAARRRALPRANRTWIATPSFLHGASPHSARVPPFAGPWADLGRTPPHADRAMNTACCRLLDLGGDRGPASCAGDRRGQVAPCYGAGPRLPEAVRIAHHGGVHGRVHDDAQLQTLTTCTRTRTRTHVRANARSYASTRARAHTHNTARARARARAHTHTNTQTHEAPLRII